MSARCGACFCALLAAIIVVGFAGSARADEHSIIRNAGDHPHYGVEIEPHLVVGLGPFTRGPSNGVGLGARFSIPIVDNGFVSTINNSVALGFGVDWLHWNGCWNGSYVIVNNNVVYTGDCSANSFLFPFVLQWNFYMSTHFSLLGELGPSLEYRSWGDACVQSMGQTVCGVNGVNHLTADVVLFVGGRYHFSQSAALTMRIGWPYFSVGVSFM